MNRYQQKKKSSSDTEQGQAIVMGTGILLALAITFLFYLAIQRAYNLANFLDETAELAAQSAAEPDADNIVSGRIFIDPDNAEDKALATVNFSVDEYGREFDNADLIELTTVGDGFEIEVINVGDPDNDLCQEFKPGVTPSRECTFPIVRVDLTVTYDLFGLTFPIGARGVATLGSNAREPEAVEVILATQTPVPTPDTPIQIEVGP